MSEIEQPESEEVNRQIHTVNMFVESHYQLNLSMLGRGPTVEMIHEAYEKLLNEHVNSIALGVKPSFDINIKKRAKEYLIANFNEEK
jgi:predicted  nucleic acid-binding Zn-ribbon protein